MTHIFRPTNVQNTYASIGNFNLPMAWKDPFIFHNLNNVLVYHRSLVLSYRALKVPVSYDASSS